MDNTVPYSSSRLKRRLPFAINKSSLKPQNALKLIVPLVIVLVLGFSIFSLFNNDNGNVAGVSDSKNLEVREPMEKITLNKTLNFPLKDGNGKEIGKFEYTLQTAELTDQIILQGSRATAVKGRQFLIVNLKLVNSLDQGIEISSRDYIRLIIDGNTKELLAPEIHNDPVEAQAISTKYTRIGFPINTTDKNLVLQVGEINGAKQTIKLDFKSK